MGIQRFRRGLWLSRLGLGSGRVGWRRNRWRDREQRLRLLWRTGLRLWWTALRRLLPLRLLSGICRLWLASNPRTRGRSLLQTLRIRLAALGLLVNSADPVRRSAPRRLRCRRNESARRPSLGL